MGTLRAIFILTAVGIVTPVGMVLQGLLSAVGAPSRRLPVLYHRLVCALLGVRVNTLGAISRERPLMIAANHASWLDICVIGSIAPVSFVAKSEVAGWPVIGTLARLQRTVFVDRERRSRTGRTSREIGSRLAAGDVIVLFAEGTSTDGNRVLPFRSALMGAAHELAREDGAVPRIDVQPAAIAYTRLNGLPMGRQHRRVVAWHGDLELPGHLWRLLKAGTVNVTVSFAMPIPLERPADRKAVAAAAEVEVRRMALDLMTGRDPG